MKARPWTDLEEAALRRLYPTTDTAEVARFVGRSTNAVKMRAIELGIRKSPAQMAKVAERTRFKRGLKPWNAGKPYQPGGRSVETRFRRGGRLGRSAQLAMPIGAERVIDGYLCRKVADEPGAAMRGNWRPVHHLVWEAAGRRIPPGHALVFRNRDSRDIRIENLELVSRAELMKRNSRHNLPPEINDLLTLRAALRRRITMMEKAG